MLGFFLELPTPIKLFHIIGMEKKPKVFILINFGFFNISPEILLSFIIAGYVWQIVGRGPFYSPLPPPPLPPNLRDVTRLQAGFSRLFKEHIE